MPTTAPATVAPAGGRASAPVLASWAAVAPTVVFQGLGEPPRTFLGAADRSWLVAPIFGEILVVEPETGGVVRRFSVASRVENVAVSADGRRLAAIEADDNWPNLPNVIWLEAWELATGRTLFRRQVTIRYDISGGLLVGPSAIALAECEPGLPARPVCAFRRFDAFTGAPLDPPSVPKRAHLDHTMWRFAPAQYSTDGRFVLITNQQGDAILYRSDPPALVAALPGKCAELDRAGRVTWTPDNAALVPTVQAALRAEGLPLTIALACAPVQLDRRRSLDGRFEMQEEQPPGLPVWFKWKNGKPTTVRVLDRASGRTATLVAAERTYSIGAFPDIGRRHDILWSENIYAKPQRYALQRGSIAEVPHWVPPLDGQARNAPDGSIYFGPDASGAVRRLRTADLSELPPLALKVAGGGHWTIDSFAPFLKDGRFLLATAGGRLVARPGDKPTVARTPWVHIFDSSANVAIAGDRFLLVGDVNLGFIVVDLATLRQVGELCASDVARGEKCADALPSADGTTAILLIGQHDERHDRLEQVTLPDGRLLASWAIPTISQAHHGTATTFTSRMGWLDPGRKLWIYGGGNGHACEETSWSQCELVVIDLATDPVGVRFTPTPGRGYITAAPDNAFFTQSTSGQHGLILFRPDGRPFLTVGRFAGGGFAFTPDGRFACEGEACRVFSCTVAGHSESIDHAACRGFRRDGFGIDQELATQ